MEIVSPVHIFCKQILLFRSIHITISQKKYVFSLFFAKRIYTFVPLYDTKKELLINEIKKR